MSEPWIRVHANLAERKVTYRLAEFLRTSGGLPPDAHRFARAIARGLLVSLWGKVSQHAVGGDIAHVLDEQLEDWAGWTGPPGLFTRWVREHHTTDGRINDWEEYQGELEHRRERDRQRKAGERARARAESAAASAGRPLHRPQDVQGYETRRHDTTREDDKSTLASTSDATVRPGASSNPTGGSGSGAVVGHVYDAGFEACWASYPSRPNDSKRKAEKAYLARVRAGVDRSVLLDGTRRYRAYCDGRGITGSELVKMAATFYGPDEHWTQPWEVPAEPERASPPPPAGASAEAVRLVGILERAEALGLDRDAVRVRLQAAVGASRMSADEARDAWAVAKRAPTIILRGRDAAVRQLDTLLRKVA
jgi:hypothetical protein